MKNQNLTKKSQSWLETLCVNIPERPVGNEGNRIATSMVPDLKKVNPALPFLICLKIY